jgi:hypothetical protein
MARYLKNRANGTVWMWAEGLSKHEDIFEITESEALSILNGTKKPSLPELAVGLPSAEPVAEDDTNTEDLPAEPDETDGEYTIKSIGFGRYKIMRGPITIEPSIPSKAEAESKVQELKGA